MLQNYYIKTLLNDGFDIGNSLMKSHSSQTLSCTLQDTKTSILLENFSFGLNNFYEFVNVSYLTFFIKTLLFNVFILGVLNGLLTSLPSPPHYTPGNHQRSSEGRSAIRRRCMADESLGD